MKCPSDVDGKWALLSKDANLMRDVEFSSSSTFVASSFWCNIFSEKNYHTRPLRTDLPFFSCLPHFSDRSRAPKVYGKVAVRRAIKRRELCLTFKGTHFYLLSINFKWGVRVIPPKGAT